MRGTRSRNQDGQLRQKRSDTKAGTIERENGVDLGVRSDKTLGALREELGVTGLKEVIEKAGK